MKKSLIILPLALLLAFLLASCGAIPSLSFFSTDTPAPVPTENLTPGTPTPTIPPPPTDIPTPTLTPTVTLTPSLTPTPKIYVPASAGEPVIDLGFAPIDLENLLQLTPVFQAMQPVVRQAVPSGDDQKLFISTSNGLFVFDHAGAQLAHWRDIFTFDLACQSCLAVDQAGSRFAVLTRNAGRWEVQVYDVVDAKWKNKKLSIPLEPTFRGADNEGQVALSPDGSFLAYAVGASALRVFNLQSGLQVFSSDQPFSDLRFSADSALFVARRDRNLLLYNTQSWAEPAELILPAAGTPFALSPDAKMLAIAFGNRLRIYAVEGFQIQREFTQPEGKTRQWELAFTNASTLQGLSVEWNGTQTLATVTTAEWNIQTGENIRLESVETASLSPFPPSWNQEFALEDSTNGVKVGGYHAFRYLGSEMLVVNSTHAVCWLKIFTGEQNCVEDLENNVFSSDTIAFKEITGEERTSVQNWRGETILDVGNYRVKAIDRSGAWILVDVRGDAADLYGAGKSLAEESVGGAFQGFTETRTLIALTTQQKSKNFVITIIDKTTGKTLTQKKDVFLYQPLLLNRTGALLMLKRDLDKGLTILQSMAPPDYVISEVARLSFPAEIVTMTYSTQENLLAFALADGSVVVYSADFGASAAFQAFDGPVTALAFSPDDRFLAAGSEQGIKVFVVKP